MPCFALCFAFAFSRLSFSACFFFRQTKNIVFTNCAKESFTFSVDLGACDVSGNDGGGNGDGKDAVAAAPSPLETGVFRFLHADGTPFLGEI